MGTIKILRYHSELSKTLLFRSFTRKSHIQSLSVLHKLIEESMAVVTGSG